MDIFHSRLLGMWRKQQPERCGMCAMNDSITIDQTCPKFGVGNSSSSHTTETSWIAGPWLGDTNNGRCVTIVDTPGIKDSEGPDCVHGVEIGKIVKEWGPISAFVLIFKGTGNRLTDAIQEQLSFYEELFGQDFWKSVVIEVSFWRSRTSDKEDRLTTRRINEAKLTLDLNNQLKQKFSLATEIPVVFVDPTYSDKSGGRRREEGDAFELATSELWKFVNSGLSFTCGGHCKSPGFLEGKPTLMSKPEINARLNDSLILKFNIWFGPCDGTDTRSYDIFKDGVKIWTVVDEQGEERTRYKPKQIDLNENTPANMEILDRCSQTVGSRESCNIELSKYKTVKLVFANITEDAFGSYHMINAKGKSDPSFCIKYFFEGAM